MRGRRRHVDHASPRESSRQPAQLHSLLFSSRPFQSWAIVELRDFFELNVRASPQSSAELLVVPALHD